MTSDTENSRISPFRAHRLSLSTRIGVAAFTALCAAAVAACSSALNIAEPADSDVPAEQSQAAGEEAETVDTALASTILPTSPGLEIDVDRVSDGDSVRASSANGDLEIRLIGINAPEQDECFGDRAGETLSALLEADSVLLHPWPAELDDFGRELGFLVADGTFVNLALVERGAAVARAQGDHEFVTEFEDAEAAASTAQVGLWAPDACGTPTDAQIEIVDALADAPGNDQENPNGEWIELENRGDAPATLSGWSVRDESTRHRYDIPEVTFAPGQRVRLFTGCGTDDLSGDPGALFWCDPEPPIWNNGGDTAFLLDSNGAIADTLGVGG